MRDLELKKEMQQKIRKPVKKAKKGILRFVFSRVTVLVVLLLLQIAILVFSGLYLGDYSKYYYTLLDIVSLVVVLYIINEKSNPAFKLCWILFVTAVPVVGLFFYLYMKVQGETRFLRRRLSELEQQTKPYMVQNDRVVDMLRSVKPANANLAHYLGNTLNFPIHQNTSVQYFAQGEEKFEELKIQLQKAERFIFLEYFIVDEGRMWSEVLDILKEKIEQGVEVRFMYDGMCNVLLPINFQKKLKNHGIKCKLYSPLRPVLSTYQNNRDHRKICVIDGKVAFTGGINLADEYINEKERFGHWKDTAVMLTGEAVQNFTMMFLQMWNISEKHPEDYGAYLTPKSTVVRKKEGFVLPYADSPFDQEDIGQQVYLHILNHAKKYVHIMTPYLILDNGTVSTLTFAAKCGIEVIIIVPHIPDKWYAHVLGYTYYEELIEAGVQIYQYTPGFVHAKVFVSDDDTAVVGTVNLDYRSFYHHFECGAFIYANSVVKDIEADFQKTLMQCKKITVEDVKKRTIFEKLAGGILKLIAPLM